MSDTTTTEAPQTDEQPAPAPATKAKKATKATRSKNDKVEATIATTAKLPKKYGFTAAKIAKLRDDQQLSWANVAKQLDLNSPSAARRAYSALVRPHTESVLNRFPNGTGRKAAPAWQPVDLAEASGVAAVRKALADHLVQVASQTKGGKPRTLFVAKVTKLNAKAGTVDVTDANEGSHTLSLAHVTGVQ